MSEEDELAQLRSNADNLSRCLHVLLEKIENIEKKNGKEQDANSTKSSETSSSNKNDGKEKFEQVEIEEKTEIDPKTGLKKRTIVTERVLTTKTFHALALDGPSPTMTPILRSSGTKSHNYAPIHQSAILLPQYQSRQTTVDAGQLSQVEVEKHGGHLVVTKINEKANYDLRPGDVVRQINGKDVYFRADIENLKGNVELTLEPAAIHCAPPNFFRIQDIYSSAEDADRPCLWLDLEVSTGDVIQILSKDDKWMQVRKLSDLTQVGYLPASLAMEKLSMLCPFGRRTLVLLGAVGTGRRDIKSMLLRLAPHYFSTIVPLTSRAQRPGEVEGREYQFVRKEAIYQKIREGGMVEWGELDNQLYGTSADAVRNEVRSGRMCILDAATQSVNYLYNAEFMPFVVHIVTRAQLQSICDESAKIGQECKSRIHLTLVNRNIDVTFKRLVDALETLRYETQWVPHSWMC
ncbi:Protein CBG12035 [Caenorhabditis briggsae]|uniref:Protein CBG12035 n=1 Tax=Caenorhabditis briggsae TaxID=6238 RepID=A8XEE6_CAEBR|nr:Protein CBG12035 [Caenorhabditis briggsae]CAP31081.2 Protein CBG12035 [Caenorhabditis briggsae]